MANLPVIDGNNVAAQLRARSTGSGPVVYTYQNETVGVALDASGVTPVANTFTGVSQSAAFTPLAGRPFNITLGAGASTVRLQRQFTGDATWYPLTDLQGNVLEWSSPLSASFTESEASVSYRLACTVYAANTAYRLSQ